MPPNRRAWAVAVTVVGIGALTAWSLWTQSPPRFWDAAAAVLSLAAALTQLWRPVTGALAATALTLFSPVATPAAATGTLQVALRRDLPVAVAVGLAGVTAHLVRWFWMPHSFLTFEWWMAIICASYGALLGWGALARSHRRLVGSLRERALRAEAEQARRVAEARAAERRSLAREMHDVLAHRLSLIATHAGALEYRPDASPERLAQAAGVVREGVHQALEELRQVIGLLREDGEEEGHAPPGLEDLRGLLAEARAAGQPVELRDQVADAPLPATTARTAHRVLQEALTNARKHAAGLPVEVSLGGGAGDGLVIEVRNPLPAQGSAPAVPGSGLGLVGLIERVRLAGGRLDLSDDGGRFRLLARLPWPT